MIFFNINNFIFSQFITLSEKYKIRTPTHRYEFVIVRL